MPMRLARLAATLLLTASLGACDLERLSGERARPVVQAPSAATAVVAQGDTVYRISQRYNVSVRAVIDANHLVPPYRLLPGQRLTIPAIAEHVVKAGDTLRAISLHYGTTPAELARINNLTAPAYLIKVGQRLTLPGTAQAVASSPEPLAAKAERRPPTVQSQPLAEPPSPSPSEDRSAPAPQPVPAQSPQPRAPIQVEAQQPAPIPVAARSGAGKPVEAYAPLTEPPALRGGFAWPARGKLLARFGVMGKGQHNDGLNIEVPRGAPIRAAADGVVAYAGNELRGFGNMLLIKHSDGWMSAYAHNDELMVRRGDTVRRGQVVAKAGASGNVRSPQLHFELRKNGDAVDPQRHLPDYRVALERAAG